jgi:hypothetical protein
MVTLIEQAVIVVEIYERKKLFALNAPTFIVLDAPRK